MDKKEKKGLAIGAAIGAVLGVIGGILFAPKSGKETRADIKNSAVTVADKLHDEAEELLAKAKSLTGSAADSSSCAAASVYSDSTLGDFSSAVTGA